MLWGRATISLATFALVGISIVGCVSEPESEEQQSTSAEPSKVVGDSVSPEPSVATIESEEPEISPFDSPLPTEFSKTQLVDRVLMEMQSWIDEAGTRNSYQVLFEEGFPEQTKKPIAELIDLAMLALPFSEESNTTFLIGQNFEFLQEEVDKLSKNIYPSFYVCGQPEWNDDAYCVDSGWVAISYERTIGRNEGFKNPGKIAVVAHELMHSWNLSIHRPSLGYFFGQPQPQGTPAWLTEGMANLFGFSIGELSGVESYLAGRNLEYRYSFQDKTVLLSDLVEWRQETYALGMVASEYFVASFGFGPLLDIFYELEKGSQFEDAFQSVTGYQLADFYEQFELSRTNLY